MGKKDKLPKGWKETVDPSGRQVWFNSKTNEMTYDHPSMRSERNDDDGGEMSIGMPMNVRHEGHIGMDGGGFKMSLTPEMANQRGTEQLVRATKGNARAAGGLAARDDVEAARRRRRRRRRRPAAGLAGGARRPGQRVLPQPADGRDVLGDARRRAAAASARRRRRRPRRAAARVAGGARRPGRRVLPQPADRGHLVGPAARRAAAAAAEPPARPAGSAGRRRHVAVDAGRRLGQGAPRVADGRPLAVDGRPAGAAGWSAGDAAHSLVGGHRKVARTPQPPKRSA